jgi:Limiting CO2-inducible proteins B/C beta carbonyic anhydrases
MKFCVAVACLVACSSAFTPAGLSARSTRLNQAAFTDAEKQVILDKVAKIFEDSPSQAFTPYVGNIEATFPGAMDNLSLENKVVSILAEKGFTAANTLLATSLCCDELARRLEDDFVKIYGNNFNLGGLSGFPFAGHTGFGAMAAHIPDNGSCLIIYGPHGTSYRANTCAA